MLYAVGEDTDWAGGVVLPFDKPLGWTSFNLVSRVRALLRHRLGLPSIKVGHAGTLDPLASGLLIVCVGRATKLAEAYQGQPKEYEATLELGATTPSFDLETAIDRRYPTAQITPEGIARALAQLVGEQLQTPPLFSAKMVQGRRAYQLARKGVALELPPARITIHRLEALSYRAPRLAIRVVCSKGTYIRALARDIGWQLGSGAHLVQLRRTAIGAVRVEQAMSPEQFEAAMVRATPIAGGGPDPGVPPHPGPKP